MGEINHSLSIVEQTIPPDELEEIREALTMWSRTNVDVWETSVAPKYGEKFKKSAFFNWCKKVRNSWESARDKTIVEKVRVAYGIKRPFDTDTTGYEKAALVRLHELLADLVSSDDISPRSLGVVSDAITQITRLNFARSEDKRRQENHEAKMALERQVEEVRSGNKDPKEALEEMLTTFDTMLGVTK